MATIAPRVRALGPVDLSWLLPRVAQSWGSTVLVSGGIAHRVEDLAGLVAEDEGPQGVLLYRLGAECEVILLEAFHRGQGVGTALLEAVCGVARNRGCSRVFVATTNDNLEALRFYQRRGFVLAGLAPGAVQGARQMKPEIPLVGAYGITIRDEIELMRVLAPRESQSGPNVFLFGGFGPSFETHLRSFAREVSGGPVVLLLQGGEGWEAYLDAYLVPLRAVGLEPVIVAPGDALTPWDLEVLAGAGGVFIGGGCTEAYHRLYATGEASATLRSLGDRGVPVAGLSAGAKVLAERVFLGPGHVVKGLGLAPVPPIFPHFDEDDYAYQALRHGLGGGRAWGLETDALVSFGPGGPRFHGPGTYLLEGGAEVRVTQLDPSVETRSGGR